MNAPFPPRGRPSDRSCRGPHSHAASRIAGRAVFAVLFYLSASTSEALAVKLQPSTVQAWDKYLLWVDNRVRHELSDPSGFLVEEFFSPDEKASVKKQLEAGQIVVRHMSSPVPKSEKFEVPNGEIHHWWGAVLVFGAKMPVLLNFLQDYDHHAGRFVDVEESRLISGEGNHFRFYFRLKRSKAFVTAIYNSEQECVYTAHSSTRESSSSVTTRIAEVENPGKPTERENPPGDDRGFLWRLASWWRFEQTNQGVIVEVESASLSRDIPTIVKFIPGVSGYIRSTPRESLESILQAIRNFDKPLK